MRILTLVLAALTAAHPAWLELVGFDPDRGSGSFETLLVVACVLVVVGTAASLVRSRC